MRDERKRFENKMRFVMKYIVKNNTLPEITELNMQALKACFDAGYLAGLHAKTMNSGRIVVDIATTPKATYEGLKFLYPPKDYKSIISTIIASIALVWVAIHTLSSWIHLI